MAFKLVHRVAKEAGVANRLHLWPEQILGADWVVQSMPKPAAYEKWLQRLWARTSEWPPMLAED